MPLGGCQLFTDTQAQVQVKESAAVRQTGPRKVRTGGWHMVPILPFSRSTLSHPVNPRESWLPGILVNHPLPANDRQRGGRWSLSRLLGVFAPFSDIDTVRDALMHYRLRCNHQWTQKHQKLYMGFGSSLSLQTSDFDEVLTSSNRSGDVFQWRAKKTLQKAALQ